ncbi:MAG: hypothetical protein BAA01_01165 [Bacillus thermozeamaize]|uniref:Uncharacterized protein n=1 Tax=Bacillus thermozeamaize TaxID=230954 RepID=A0A1Y3PFB9_9BACI|nr:MAG: hypothetical protein BAA01_01165 [Bacillus thermozeamaize]
MGLHYRAWTIQLKAESPLMIGGHRLDNNRYASLDYIPHHVLQAAFARAILETHEHYSLDKHTNDKLYYIDPNHQEITDDGCHPQWQPWFRVFPQLCFNDARPMGRTLYTPTTFACKHSSSHPLRETLLERYLSRNQRSQLAQFKCPVCQGRLERKNGWRMPSDEKLYYRKITRVGLDERRLVSRDEHLYTLSVLEPYRLIDPENGQAEPLYFYGTVYAPQEADLSLDEAIIHVGAYLTSGFGRMRIRVTPADTTNRRQAAFERWRQWQEQAGNSSVAIQLLSDVELPLVCAVDNKYQTREQWLAFYTQLLRQCSGLPENVTVEAAYLNSFQRRYVHNGPQFRRADKLTTLLQQGSVFILNGPKAALEPWLDEAIQCGMPWQADDIQRRLSLDILSGEAEPSQKGGNTVESGRV